MRKIPAPYTDPTPLFRHGGSAVCDGTSLVDFSVNVNPLGPPPSVLDVLRRELPAVARYPDPECTELTKRLAVIHGVAPAQVVVGNGSNELIHAIARAFCPRRVAIADPTYTEYLRASLLVGAEVDHWLAEGDDFQLEPFDPATAEVVWLCNPNNPTGRLWSPQVLRRWIEDHPRQLFVVDEAFLPFLAGEPEHSLIGAAGQESNLVVIRSLTKYFAMPGLRLGYAVASSDTAHRLRDQLTAWSVNSLAQTAGVAALADAEFAQQTRRWFDAEQGRLQKALTNVMDCLEPVPSQANFILLRLANVTSQWLIQRLSESHILARDASNFVGLNERHVRIAVKTCEENRVLMRYLWEFLVTADEYLTEDDI